MFEYWNEFNNPELEIYKDKLDHVYKDVLKLIKILSALVFHFKLNFEFVEKCNDPSFKEMISRI